MQAATAIADPYPTRVQSQPDWVERLDPVVYPGGPGAPQLSAEDLSGFEKNGFLFAESLLAPAEVRELTQELASLASNPDVQRLEETITEPEDDNAVRSLFRVHKLSRLFEWLARDERILGVARQILGSDVYLHQSRANLKPGFRGKEFYWHSDFETWHAEDGMPRMRALSVSIALSPNFAFNGPLMLIPGSHKTFVPCLGKTPHKHYRKSLKKQEFGVPDEESLRRLAERGGIVAPTGQAGSALFFDCNTMHGSGSNISPYPRSNLFFVYNSVENTLVEPFCGLTPRPEHIATRESFEPLIALDRG